MLKLRKKKFHLCKSLIRIDQAGITKLLLLDVFTYYKNKKQVQNNSLDMKLVKKKKNRQIFIKILKIKRCLDEFE